MSNFLSEAFRKLEGLNEDTFEITKDGLKKLDKFMEEDDNVEQEEITVYDMWGEDTEKEQEEKSIVGKIILECDSCHSLTFLGDDEVVIDDETNSANADMECPYCHSMNGFAVVGKVCPVEEEKTEEEVEEKEEIDESCKSKKTKNEHNLSESLIKRFKSVSEVPDEEVNNKNFIEELEKILGPDELYGGSISEIKDFDIIQTISVFDDGVDSHLGCRFKALVSGDFGDDEHATLEWIDFDFSDKNNMFVQAWYEKDGDDFVSTSDYGTMWMKDISSKIIDALANNVEYGISDVFETAEQALYDYVPVPSDDEVEESVRTVKKSKKTKNELLDANIDLSNFGGQGNDVSVLSPGGGLSKMLPVGEELDDDEEDRREQRRKDRRKARRDVRRAKRTNEPVDESVKNEDHQANNVLTKYQRWVDYDMKKYGKISKITQKALDKAGFEVVKDDHGDYEVIANTNESCDKKSLKESNYRGAKDVKFVSHGGWADPDLVYNGYTFNYWDIEDALWSMFLEDTGHKDSESDDPKVEEEFDKYVQDNVVSCLEDAIAGGYFAKGKKSWHESLNKKNVNEAPIYDLGSRFDSRQSFYGKARVDTGDKGDKNKLYSYNTLVAEIKDGKPVVYGTYSATTLRHIKEWLKQLGFKAENKAQIERDYLVKNESLKEDLSYGELVSISNEWEKFKKDTGRSDAESAREFIEKKYKKEYDDEEREDIFGYISTLEESFKDVTITTDDTHMEMTSDENGKVTVTTEPVCKECEEKEEVIEPLTDEDEVEIEKKSFDNENDDEVEVDFDEFDEETFESLTESFLKKTYNNVKSFKVNEEKDNGVSATKDGKIIVEGKITFNSGAQKDTKFIFEGHQATKRGKVKLIGENAQITNGKKAFTITGSINNKKLVVESLNYNYRQKNPITHKADRIYGTVKNK